MANQESKGSAQATGPLFKDTDKQEQLYAPEQRPDTHIPAHEIDVGGAAGSDTSVSTDSPDAAPIAAPGNAPSAAMAPAGQRKTRTGQDMPDSPDPLDLDAA